jgi:transposase InsO family protein
VSTSGYYDWVARVAAGPCDAERDDVVVLERIRKIHKKSRGRYGEPRITAQLARDGVPVNHKRVERLMVAELRRGWWRLVRAIVGDGRTSS